MNSIFPMLLRSLNALTCASVLFAGVCHGQATPANDAPSRFWPEGISWNTDIPSPKDFFGFEIGDRHLRHDQIVAYLQMLAEKSDRVELATYGQTQGGRPLLLLTISSPKNLENIESIRREHRRLNDASVSEQVDIDALPVVMNMGYCVHGDEPSAGNVSPLVAHLLAAGEGEFIEQVLDRTIILLDPCLNPDGFERFSHWANRYQGLRTVADPAHAEHNQGWPAGRLNHYWFDLNRDWMPLTQKESQARMTWFHQWKPDVVLDFHEMGSNSTFFFQPGEPLRRNPFTPEENVELTGRIAEFHARVLDNQGSVYFTEEVFDDFYMGKGSTYPDLHGAVGILFEQGSSRGQQQETANGLLTFADTIRNQFAASRSSLQAVVAMRHELLDYKRRFYSDAAEMAAGQSVRTHLFTAPGNHSRLQDFANLLLQHDIDCYWLKDDFAYGEQEFDPAATLVVPTDQAEFRFLQSMLDKRTDFEENVFYDVSAWTMPLAFGLQQHDLSRIIPDDLLTKAKIGKRLAAPLEITDSDIAYLIDWRDDKAAFWVNRILDREYLVKVAMQPLAVDFNGERIELSPGTCLVALGPQTNSVPQLKTILRRASADGVRIVPVATGLTPQGIDLGSNQFGSVQPVKLAMFVGEGISANQAGAIWHSLDTRFGIAPSLIQQPQVATVPLERYSTIVYPAGNYGGINARGLARIKAWVSDGGTAIFIGSSTEFAMNALLGDGSESKADSPAVETMNDGPLMKPFGAARDELALELVSGAIFEAEIDVTNPLFFGFTESKLATFRNSTQVLLRSPSPYAHPAVYSESPLLAGYCNDTNAKKIGGTPCIVVHPLGRGRIILLADDPAFRGFWRTSTKMFVNAILFGDHCDPPRMREEDVDAH